MSEFEDRLRERLERNQRLAEERSHAEKEMDRAAERAREEAAREAKEKRERQDARHAELAERLTGLVGRLRDSVPNLTVRAGWSASGEEFLAKFATVRTRPERALSIVVDRDDDQVIVRWNSDLGDSMELYHLLEFDTDMLEEVVLQAIDDDLWSSRSTPPVFPGNHL